ASEIPGLYFAYLRTGNARGLQPVFYHNALDVISLAALGVELARTIRRELETSPAVSVAGAGLALAGPETVNPQALERTELHPLDLFSISRICGHDGVPDHCVSTCER